MVFAAKCDGYVDDLERSNIAARVQELNLGHDAQTLIDRAMNEQLDPHLIAKDVTSAEEAVQLFAISCAVIRIDHFLEHSYLDALAKALHIPDDLKNDIMTNLKSPAARCE